MAGQIPLSDSIVKECNGFDPRYLLKIFLTGILEAARGDVLTPMRSEICGKIVEYERDCYNSVMIYNLTPASALERLSRDLASIRRAFISQEMGGIAQ